MADVYNVIRGDGVFFEGMTKEQIISAIAEATGKTVEDIDSAFITKLKEINKGNALRLWMGTNAEYNKIEPKEDDVLYYVTDDTFVEDISSAIVDMQNKIDANYDSLTEDFNALESGLENKINDLDKYYRDRLCENPSFVKDNQSSSARALYGVVSLGGVPSYTSRTFESSKINQEPPPSDSFGFYITIPKPDDENFNFSVTVICYGYAGDEAGRKTFNYSDLPLTKHQVLSVSNLGTYVQPEMKVEITGQF